MLLLLYLFYMGIRYFFRIFRMYLIRSKVKMKYFNKIGVEIKIYKKKVFKSQLVLEQLKSYFFLAFFPWTVHKAYRGI